MNTSTKVPQQAIDLVKKFEGCKLKAYRCPAGVWTIGYGTTKGVVKGMEINQEDAERMLAADLMMAQNCVKELVKVKLNDNQLSALTSFVYNVGRGAFLNSNLLAKLNKDGHATVPSELGRWVYGNVNGVKKILPGLAARRHAEAKLWDKAV